MTKNMLTYISHQFCLNCCGESKKCDCDTRNVTCDKLANFLVECHKYQEPINEDKLDVIAKESKQFAISLASDAHLIPKFTSYENGYKAGYRQKAMEG